MSRGIKSLPFLRHDPQFDGAQYLEDLATGYWFSEVLFTAVEAGIFKLLEPKGKEVGEIADSLNFHPKSTERFLAALTDIGLITSDGQYFYNTKLAREYLVEGKENYQGDSILWRKNMADGWRNLDKCLRAGGRVDYAADDEKPEERQKRYRRYISAMDNVARIKVGEILPFFQGLSLKGKILDIGAGSGAVSAGFLTVFPETRATLLDLSDVLEYSAELLSARKLVNRVDFCSANILEPWPLKNKGFDLVILSNIVHAYAEEEISFILEETLKYLNEDGLVIIHDFFLEHYQPKGVLSDLNMFINTYNGKVFSEKWIRTELTRLSLYTTEMISLETDTALIFAAKRENVFEGLKLDPNSRMVARLKNLGFHRIKLINAEEIHVPDWADLRCQFGCGEFGKRHCPPNSPGPEKTRALLKDYTTALLLEGEPPTGDFQRRVLQAEKMAFQAGFHRAFSFWAGPCTLCNLCQTDGICKNTREARPSMEGAGIDVFETMKRAGFNVRTLSSHDDYVKYFALLLLE